MKYRALLRTPQPTTKAQQTHSNSELVVRQWAHEVLRTAPTGSYVNIYITEEKLLAQLGKIEEEPQQ